MHTHTHTYIYIHTFTYTYTYIEQVVGVRHAKTQRTEDDSNADGSGALRG